MEFTVSGRSDYSYGLYRHRLLAPNGAAYTRSFIVIRNRYNVIVQFTTLQDYVGIYERKSFVPITSDAESRLYYVCMMLNYILIEHYDDFGIDDVRNVTFEALARFFSHYAIETKSDGSFRGEQSVEKCIGAVTGFFRKLRRKLGNDVLLTEAQLAVGNGGKTSAFQAKGIASTESVFRDLPTKAFKVLLNLAFRYAPDIAFALCLQAFAGLRVGEVCNVRQEGSPVGNGIIISRIGNSVRKVEIDITRELPMRGDGVICGRIKKERRQCVYPHFLEAFATAYELHLKFLQKHKFEREFCPMFVNNRGMAMTRSDYIRKFAALVAKRFRPALLASGDPELKLYGQLLYENKLTPHALRHWFSVQLVLHGEDIAQVQYWRGDSNPESAFTYLQNKGDLVRELELTSNALVEALLDQGKMEVSDWIK